MKKKIFYVKKTHKDVYINLIEVCEFRLCILYGKFPFLIINELIKHGYIAVFNNFFSFLLRIYEAQAAQRISPLILIVLGIII